MLTKRFGQQFTRTIGSGNRWGQVSSLPQHAQETFSGDVVCPANFRFVVECKGGYDDLDLIQILAEGNALFHDFIAQVTAESERTGKRPLLVWKKARRPWFSFVRECDVPGNELLESFVMYTDSTGKEWIGLPLKRLLAFPNSWWFTK